MANESRLVLPKPFMAKLDSRGIYCQTWVTAERQDRAEAVGTARSRKRREREGIRPVHFLLRG